MEDDFRQDTSDHENDDDDALSLSDLPIYGGGADETPEKEDLGVKEYTSSLSFEFFSEEWSSTILSKDSNDNTKDTPTVVFCGKVMPHDETPVVAVAEEDGTVVRKKKKGRKFGYRRLSASLWNFNSLGVSGRYVDESGYKDGISVKRVNSIEAAPRVKWYLYIFGLARCSPNMDVGDLRRKSGSSISRRSSGGSNSGDRESKSSNDGDCGKGVGWWILISVLGCGCICGGGGGDDHDIAPRLGV